MTTYANHTDTCGACGHVFASRGLMSTNSFGSADLDTRPPEMRRSTMDVWVIRCPSCGYCAKRISVFDDRLRPVLESLAYRSQLGDANFPELASTFICHEMLLASAGERYLAAWAHLHAAWCLEDAGKKSWRGRGEATLQMNSSLCPQLNARKPSSRAASKPSLRIACGELVEEVKLWPFLRGLQSMNTKR